MAARRILNHVISTKPIPVIAARQTPDSMKHVVKQGDQRTADGQLFFSSTVPSTAAKLITVAD